MHVLQRDEIWCGRATCVAERRAIADGREGKRGKRADPKSVRRREWTSAAWAKGGEGKGRKRRGGKGTSEAEGGSRGDIKGLARGVIKQDSPTATSQHQQPPDPPPSLYSPPHPPLRYEKCPLPSSDTTPTILEMRPLPTPRTVPPSLPSSTPPAQPTNQATPAVNTRAPISTDTHKYRRLFPRPPITAGMEGRGGG